MESRRRWRWSTRGLLIVLFLLCSAVLAIIPFAYMIISSLKTNLDVLAVPFQWIPKQLHFENYWIPLVEKPFARYFGNSFIVAFAVTLGQVVTCSLAGYSLSKFRYPGRSFIFYLILSQLMIPFPVIMVALFLIIKHPITVHCNNNHVLRMIG